jgi:hypothetical protein
MGRAASMIVQWPYRQGACVVEQTKAASVASTYLLQMSRVTIRMAARVNVGGLACLSRLQHTPVWPATCGIGGVVWLVKQ